MAAGDRIYVADKETLDKIYAILTDGDCYGFIEHGDIADPESRIEAIGINKDYTNITVDKAAHTYSLGSWATFPVITENKPWMVKASGAPDYQLSETDYTKKADGVTASDVSNAWRIFKDYQNLPQAGNDRQRQDSAVFIHAKRGIYRRRL